MTKSRKNSSAPESGHTPADDTRAAGGLTYTGRFAPSPTGPLHFGSLLAAVASWLDTRANSGRWLVRIEDIDPPREVAGAAEIILNQLKEFGLDWEGEVLYQSSRLAAYDEALGRLELAGLCYPCDCSRAQVREMGGLYDGHCRKRKTPPASDFAIRVRTDDQPVSFDDLIQGHCEQYLESETGDFVIRRRDGRFAYQLAVVVDDDFQGVTHVIRGHDLLDSTPRQIWLQQLLGHITPVYGHIPVIVDAVGEKLSKQRFAEPIRIGARRELLHRAIGALGQAIPAGYRTLGVTEQLEWAVSHWDIQKVPKLATIPYI